MILSAISSVLAGWVLAGSGCGGTETGNPPFAPDVGYGGFEPMGLAPDPTVDNARVSIDEMMVVDCDGARFPLLRRIQVDFVTGAVTVGEALEIPPGTYCAVELAIAACDDPDRCRTLAPDAVSIDGTRRGDGADVQIRDQGTLDVALEGEGFELGPDAGGVLLALDINAVVAGLQITSAPVGADGIVLVDAATDPTRLQSVRDGIAGGLSLRRDLDDDGELDDEELLDAPLAATTFTPAP